MMSTGTTSPPKAPLQHPLYQDWGFGNEQELALPSLLLPHCHWQFHRREEPPRQVIRKLQNEYTVQSQNIQSTVSFLRRQGEACELSYFTSEVTRGWGESLEQSR